MSRIRGFFGALFRDRSGNVAVYTAVVASALIGMVGLALDGSRLIITDSEAQAAADAAALAAAMQLDGGADAFDDARSAAQGALVSNRQRFADGAADTVQFALADIRFLKSLPDDDETVLDATELAKHETSDVAQALYVLVRTEALTHNNSFLQVVGAAATSTVTAEAVAGISTAICNETAFLLCTDQSPESLIGTAQDVWEQGEMLEYPCCDTLNEDYRREFASGTPNACFGTKVQTVDSDGAAVGNVTHGVNVRFDDYGGGLSASDGPPDTLIAEFNYSTPVQGQAAWNCDQYWTANHDQTKPAALSWCQDGVSGPGKTRWDMYKWEQENAAAYPQKVKPDPTHNPTPGRRVVYVAMSDQCSAGAIPVAAYMKALLLTKADGSGPNKHLWVEPVEIVLPGDDDGVVRENVQLYR